MKLLYVCYTAPRLFRETRGGTPDRALALSQRGRGGVRVYASAAGSQESPYMSVPKEDVYKDKWGETRLRPESADLVRARNRVVIDVVEDPAQVVSLGEVRTESLDLIDHPDLPFLVAKRVIPGPYSQCRSLAKKCSELTGKNYHIPDILELRKASRVVGEKLEGVNYRIWTSDITGIGDGEEMVLYYQPEDRPGGKVFHGQVYNGNHDYTGFEAARFIVDRD